MREVRPPGRDSAWVAFRDKPGFTIEFEVAPS
jgi:hypothetical protein